MWLEANQRYELSRADGDGHVTPWMVDVVEFSDEADGMVPFSVGRILADELRPNEIREWGGSVWHVADGDSGGLLAAYTSLLDADGEFRHEEFDAIGEPIVYMYRFELHEDFTDWKLPVLDSFCRLFRFNAVILAQYETTWFSLSEFEQVGFRPLATDSGSIEISGPAVDQPPRFLVRDNALTPPITFSDYPTDSPDSTEEHEEWVESKGPWDGHC